MTMTMKKTKIDKNSLKHAAFALVILLAAALLLVGGPKSKVIDISREDVMLDISDPCKNASVVYKSLFFLKKEWLPETEQNISCFVDEIYRGEGNRLNIVWNTNDVKFFYTIYMNRSEPPCTTRLFFGGYPERKMPYPKNLSEQLQFISRFLDLSYFCFDPNKTHFFSDDFDGSTELYNFYEVYDDVRSLGLSRSRYHRYPETEGISIARHFRPPECANPIITDIPVRDYSKNETCLKTDGPLTGESYESNWVWRGRKNE